MAKQATNQTVIALALVLVLLVIGGTFMILQGIREIKRENARPTMVYITPPVPSGSGQVTLYVINPQNPGPP